MEAIVGGVLLVLMVLLGLPVLALAMLVRLRHRMVELERRLADLQREVAPPKAEPSAQGGISVEQPVNFAPSAALSIPPSPPGPNAVPVPFETSEGSGPSKPAESSDSSEPPEPGVVTQTTATLTRWFTEGNVPVKVGMLVLLAGVAALLKYAGDQGWLSLPLELRYAGIAMAALLGVGLGWRQRARRRGFALALQGGAIAVLLLVIFAAARLSGLLPVPAAFALSVVLVAGLCVLAVLQESPTLAVLGILAGFLAPIWLSTGEGHHVVLFSYYALLNAAVFAIAWVRTWRVLNLIGFVFTFGIGTAWGVLAYRPEHFVSTEPFLLLFFAFYLLIPVLHARRGDGRSRIIDGSLLFGTPLAAFSMQAGLLHGERMALAVCALGLAALYAAFASWLLRAARSQLLGQGHAVLAVAFATLAVPLALSAHTTVSVFALEGAGLLWLGVRQQRVLPQVSGVALQLAAAIGFMLSLGPGDQHAIANPTFMSALLIALAGLVSAGCLHAHGRRARALLAYLWGLGWWACAALTDILRFASAVIEPDLILAWLALSVWLAAEMWRWRSAVALAWTVVAGLALALPVVDWQVSVHAQPFGRCGGWAWLVFVLLGLRALAVLRGAGAARAQLAWLMLWPVVLALVGAWLADRYLLADGWCWALLCGPWLLLAALAQVRWDWLIWPQHGRLSALRRVVMVLVYVMLTVGWLWALIGPASPAPLPWVPLFNPVELGQLATLVVAAYWLHGVRAPVALRRRRPLVVVGGGLVLVTASVLRSVHHWGQIPWDDTLLSSSLTQTSLTVVWSILGVIGWVLGSRRGQRGLWLAGALLMALVLVKLVLVDRQHLGNLLGIGSFIAYGLLCTAVGYLAPAPPRGAPPEVRV